MSENDDLPCVEQNPDSPAVASVVWLHGLGADGHDFAPVPPVLGLPPELPVRFVFPHAPSIPVTLNMGFVMPAWYDIQNLGERGHDVHGVERSAKQIRRLVEREGERGVKAHRIVLAGFSQGAAMALHVGLRYPERLAGILALSGYLLFGDRLDAEASDANRKTPIFQAHGVYDPMVELSYGMRSRALLEEKGYDVAWHEYPMEHAVCPQELADVGAWLRDVLRR
jgi:phospholipase/carboxylesterase